jgi:hypothetical protein
MDWCNLDRISSDWQQKSFDTKTIKDVSPLDGLRAACSVSDIVLI